MSQTFTIVDWQDDKLVLLDQRRLPAEEVYLRISDWREAARAIRELAVRGAPAIGVAAAMGLALAASRSKATDRGTLLRDLEAAAETLRATRPTAVNLAWALRRMLEKARDGVSVDSLKASLIAEAILIKEEDIRGNREIGRNGEGLLSDGDTVLTHCNAGALATAGFGTALGVVYAATSAGKKIRVMACETRPVLQGARLTAWELKKSGVPVTVIADNMAAHFMKKGIIAAVIVGADRIAANGDTANKIGTYALAVLAKHHGIPFYVAAPISSVDPATPNGSCIPIEEREGDEIAVMAGTRLVPEGVEVRNPAFDVTPAELITAIVTEKGMARPPFGTAIRGWTA